MLWPEVSLVSVTLAATGPAFNFKVYKSDISERVKLHLQLSQLLLYICSSYICSCNISGWSHLQFNLYAVSTNAIDHICSWGTTFAGPHLQFKYQNFRGYITLSEIRQWVTDCNTLSIHRHVQPFFSFWN